MKIFLIAGEASGDVLGARLMPALAGLGPVEFAGIGGPLMAAAGLNSLFPQQELAVMGFLEVLPHLRRLARRLDQTVAAVRDLRPDAVVTIDSPGFGFRVQQRLAGLGIRRIHYVAPSVWAWRPGRARKVAGFLDRLLCLLPFEPAWFTPHGLAADFVGHPAVEAVPGDAAAFRRRHAIPGDRPLLAVLPGSRRGEVSRLLDIFLAAAREQPGARLAVPVVEGVRDAVAAALPGDGLMVGQEEKADLFAAADAALCASGTASLELSLAGVPTVVAYRLNPLTHALARRLVRLRHVSLTNILLEQGVIPEFLQGAATAPALSAALRQVLDDAPARQRQREAGERVRAMLTPAGGVPSLAAALAIRDAVSRPPRAGPGGAGG